ncbi:hypothetical protein CCAL9344_00485 [Campylobacter sp. RM9344]|uniref:SMI1/KNR4 family protein n=1 Tax=Campylobacter californiensis TaxID=1032243 RepID=A0AAW3ZS29_9BACT|nr:MULTISPECIES: hypothetical protein [unclassified Campylobacter]MBE2983827.1 hypothetical protein [Campylobacter sp. RM6883]MBE2994365.1 hypothetical protein [Campylobacter sp. RM6913]MBE3028673.1 hypothetical protein [Campylobacter sp. RM9344]MBE3607562.1 hypothetical protein [Campylobacter sp. RM9337]QCD50956.1 hypothetical protein CCAL_1054 [Campylobacter sp. RM6914]
MGSLKNLKSRILELGDEFSYVDAAENAADLMSVNDFEQHCGFRLCDDLVEFVCALGMIAIKISPEILSNLKENDSQINEIYVYGISKGKTPEWMKLKDFNAESVCFFEQGESKAYVDIDGVVFTDEGKFDGDMYDFIISKIDELEEKYSRLIPQNTQI